MFDWPWSRNSPNVRNKSDAKRKRILPGRLPSILAVCLYFFSNLFGWLRCSTPLLLVVIITLVFGLLPPIENFSKSYELLIANYDLKFFLLSLVWKLFREFLLSNYGTSLIHDILMFYWCHCTLVSPLCVHDHFCYQPWKRTPAPWGSFRTPHRERLNGRQCYHEYDA